MPSYYDDDWEYTDFSNEDSCDEEPELTYSDLDDYEDYAEYDVREDTLGPLTTIRQPVWKRIRVDDDEYMVSDQGCIKKPDTLFEVHYGLEEHGTPFRTVTFPNGKTYYMHDLVWQTFNGDPPRGWEVRHTFAESQKNRRYYSNALRHLTIIPERVTLRPRIFL